MPKIIKPEPGMRIETKLMRHDFEWRRGTVVQLLSAQFTIDYDDGSYGFVFYTDEWRPYNPVGRII